MKSTAADFLHRTDEKFRSGYRREAAGLMWEAAQATFAGWHKRAGWNTGILLSLRKRWKPMGRYPNIITVVD